jgi:hypothetical protein
MAVNTNIFTGADAILTLAVLDPNSVEGGLAQGVIETNELDIVGRASDVEVHVTTDLRAYHEIGKRLPAQLHAGNVNVMGKIGRAYINGALLNLLLGDYVKDNNATDPLAQPSFNLVMLMTDPAAPGTSSVMTIHGVKLENWAFVTPEDDFVMESVTFKGKSISVTDNVG